MAFSRQHGLPPNGGRDVFADVRRYFGPLDIATGNLEGTLGKGGPSKCRGNCHAFQAPSSYAGVFRRAGFDLLNLANNHSRDFGTSGLDQTLAALRRERIAHTGLNGTITVKRVRGVRVAFVGFAPYPWTSPLTDIPAARKLVVSAGRRADVVVVMMHAGAEGSGATHTPHGTETAFGENRGAPREFARTMVDAGADAVLGSGPHVLRGIECRRNALIAYSLGNFAGWRTLSTSGVLALSAVLELRLSPDGRFEGGQLRPVRLTGAGIPRRDPSRASVGLVRRLSKEDFGARACRISATGRIAPR
jgi:poly-gamma-glutamate capsule biosynthesis protein CapA/YwtB (metallophosphatase superfamily)